MLWDCQQLLVSILIISSGQRKSYETFDRSWPLHELFSASFTLHYHQWTVDLVYLTCPFWINYISSWGCFLMSCLNFLSKKLIWLKYHWRLFLRVQSTIWQYWFRYWLRAVPATCHYLNQWWFIYCCKYVSLGLNELIVTLLFMFWFYTYIYYLCLNNPNSAVCLIYFTAFLIVKFHQKCFRIFVM